MHVETLQMWNILSKLYKHTMLINSCVHTGMDSEGSGVVFTSFVTLQVFIMNTIQ